MTEKTKERNHEMPMAQPHTTPISILSYDDKGRAIYVDTGTTPATPPVGKTTTKKAAKP
jgi:hypothetical protein